MPADSPRQPSANIAALQPGLDRWQKAFAAESPASVFVDITAPVKAVAAPRPQAQDTPHWQVELELGAGVTLRIRAG